VSAGRAEVLALIPARGGSKSIPRKNLRPLGGHPLIAWSIAAARASARVDLVIVSSDDEEIRSAAAEYGAEAPFLRPASLAQDDTPDLPVFLHALRWLEEQRGRRPEIVVQLRPTSPLRPPALVDEAIARIEGCPEADSLRSVTPPNQNPYKMWTHRDRWLRPVLGRFSQELFNRPRQKLPIVWWQTGHLDVVRRTTLLDQRSMTGRRILPFAVDPRHAIDIDTPDQWAFAEWLIASADLDLVRPIPVEESA
jgi:CMP-N-acetylneuraminic acid synthetase